MQYVEQIPADEQAQIARVLELILAKQRAAYKPGEQKLRDVHQKGYLVPAIFHVLPRLAPELQIGLFAHPVSFKASVRFSNGLLGPTGYDIMPNTRAMAIKVHGVPGKKLRLGDPDSPDHDFLTVNGPVFQVANLRQYIAVSESLPKGLLKYPEGVPSLLRQIFQLVRDPLCIDYFSQASYLFGDHPVKWIINHEQQDNGPLPNPFDRDYLRHAVEAHLQKRPARLTFCAQFAQLEKGETPEDPTQYWTGKPVPLAQIEFPILKSPILAGSGEGLAFDPWRVLAEHRPLGWVGRTRRIVYKKDSEFRGVK